MILELIVDFFSFLSCVYFPFLFLTFVLLKKIRPLHVYLLSLMSDE